MLKILLFEAASKISSSKRLLNSASCDRRVFESTLATYLGVSIVGSVETFKYRPGLLSIFFAAECDCKIALKNIICEHILLRAAILSDRRNNHLKFLFQG